MKEHKVLYVINHSCFGGANSALLNMLDGIVELGFCTMVVMATKGEICSALESRKINYKVINHHFSIYPSLGTLRDVILFIPRIIRIILNNHQAVKQLSKVVKTFKPEIIHTNIGPDHVGFQVAKKLNIPHVWHFREYQDLYYGWHPMPSKREFMRRIHFSNNYPIAITHGLFNHYNMHSNACVIYDGVMRKSQTQFVVTKEKYFLFVGRLEEAKGIRILIRSFIELCKRNTDFELLIAGTGGSIYVKELNQLVDDAKITKHVNFLGFQTDVNSLMSKATALIVPSRYEGFGFITVEAMFNGCLVIGNNSGGTKEILGIENLGILYSKQDELVTAMNTVVSNGIESYYSMIKKAQKRAVALYSQEQNINVLYHLYKDIINKNNI